MKQSCRRLLAFILAMLCAFSFGSLTVMAEEIILISPKPVVTDYGIWVGAVKVTPENKDNITGDGITLGDGGYIRYDSETKTLTMNNASVTSYSEQPGQWNPADTYLCGLQGSTQLNTLELRGSNEIALDVNGAESQVYGLQVSHIIGDGSLSVSIVNAGGNGTGIESNSSLTVENAVLDISVESTAEPTSTNLIGIRVPYGLTFRGSKVNIAVGNAKNNASGIDSMRDLFFYDSDVTASAGSCKFTSCGIFAMAHPMDGITVGLTMEGGSLSASGKSNAVRFHLLDMGTDAWYQYAINEEAVTPSVRYTDSAETALSVDQLYLAMNLQIVPRGTVINPYTDIAEADWYYEDVLYAFENNLMQGTGDGGFSPDMLTDRSMLVTVLWRMEGSPAVIEDGTAFDDVPANQWYYTPIIWAAQNELVKGTGETSYNPTGSLTREQIALILYRYANTRGAVDAAEADISAYTYSAWAADSILWAESIGLFDGIGVDVSDLTATASRAEIAAYLRRFCENNA